MKKNFKRGLATLLAGTMMMPMAVSAAEDDIVTLKCYMLGNPATKDDLNAVVEAMNEITREEIGAELDWTIIDGGSMSEKMNVIMASGEAFDICFTGYCNNYKNAALNGGLYDITDLLEECPGITEAVPDYALDQCYIDGRLYGIPNMQVLTSYYTVAFRKDLVEKYDFDYESVETIADIEPFLEQVVENDPDYIPTGASMGAYYLDRAFTDNYLGLGSELVYSYETGELMSRLECPEFLDVINRAHDWYEKGYIRSDVLTVENWDTELQTGRVACWSEVGKPGLESEVFNKYGVEVVTVPITSYRLGSPVSTMLSVGANSENPLKALQLIELLNTNEELHNLAVYGIEGTHYNLNDEGKVEPVENAGYNQVGFTWALGNQFITKLMYNQDDDVWEVTKELNDKAQLPKNFGFSIPSDVNEELENERAAISAIIGEYDGIMTNGVKDPDEYLDTYRERIADNQAAIMEAYEPILEDFFGAAEEETTGESNE